jgi:hypothetical protein
MTFIISIHTCQQQIPIWSYVFNVRNNKYNSTYELIIMYAYICQWNLTLYILIVRYFGSGPINTKVALVWAENLASTIS